MQSVTTALEAVGGIMTAAAHYLGVDRSTVYRFINENPELKDVRADIEDQTKDMAEGKIVTAIKNGEMDTVRWYADRKMRDRGYGHQAKVEGPGKDGAFRHEVATIDPSKMSTEALRELRAATLDQDAADAE
ncbi:helix-turn-helix domain-containing protein [Roseovarius sp. MMSF_3281]|uniref:helix-turn-helix domain-containing protein n=1 Tax=Roseovarius sp. MMSF_3281 TaxID=3046694 RepID=UPI00273EC66A|nr:helix-turn-helix domain-containing protein [Roseovarius sp. MMSF_3281]